MSKKPSKRIPKLCHHKGTGLAYVTLNGREIYLGEHGSPLHGVGSVLALAFVGTQLACAALGLMPVRFWQNSIRSIQVAQTEVAREGRMYS